MRRRFPDIVQAAAFLPMIGAVAIVAWQSQGGGLTLAGSLAAGMLLALAWLLAELPYRIDAGAQKKTPSRAGTRPRASSAKHHENHHDYSTAA